VTEEILVVEPGTYTVMLWLDDIAIGFYSRWVPAMGRNLDGCEVVFEVEEGQGTSLTVTGGFADVQGGSMRCTTAPPTTNPVPSGLTASLDEMLLISENLPAPYRGPRQPIEEEFWDSGIQIPFCENGLMVLTEPSLEMLTVGLPAAVAFEGDRAGATQVLYAGTSPVMPVGDAFDDVAHELDECVAEWEQDPAIGIVDEYTDDGWQWVVEQPELDIDRGASYALRYYTVDGDGTNAGKAWGRNHTFAMVRTDTHLMLLELRDGLDDGPIEADEFEKVIDAALDRLSNA
jgi:hypothetical protein